MTPVNRGFPSHSNQSVYMTPQVFQSPHQPYNQGITFHPQNMRINIPKQPYPYQQQNINNIKVENTKK
jgi:hypothetical protein